MADTREPRWDLLPSYPEAFFGLEGDYGLEQLRSRYSVYLRQFKPEQFPAEFQKLRAAYETLLARLQAGDTQVGPEVPNHQDSKSWWAAGTPEGVAPRGDIDPLVQYQTLKQRSTKSPSDYYALAVLSDVVQDESQFFEWLAAGVAEFPDDAGLANLLSECLCYDVTVEEAIVVLPLVSGALKSERFFYLTERLWDRILSHAVFDQFRATLDECQQCIPPHQAEARIAFYVHILKPAMWKADEAWTLKTMEFIEEHHDSLPDWMDEELHTLDLLLEYRRSRRDLHPGTLQERIDAAINAHCTQPSELADRVVIECQHAILESPSQFLREFPIGETDHVGLRRLWHHIVEDVLRRCGEPSASVDQSETRELAKKLLYSVSTENKSSRRCFFGEAAVVLISVTITTVVAAIIMRGIALYRAAVRDEPVLPYVGEVVVLVVLGGTLLALMLFVLGRITDVRYQDARPSLFQLVHGTNISRDELFDILADLAPEKIQGVEVHDACEMMAVFLKDEPLDLLLTTHPLMP